MSESKPLVCPKCGDDDIVTNVNRPVYIVSDKDMIKKTLHMCNGCKTYFIDISEPPTKKKNQFRKMFSDISSGCERVFKGIE